MSLRPFVETCCTLAAAAAIGIEVLAQIQDPALQYKERGLYYEGLRAIPIAGGLQLLSAHVIPDRPNVSGAPRPPMWADRARLRFYLPEEGTVTVTVRQLRSGSTYYLLDRVTARWTAGAVNEFTWPTDPVLRKLSSVRAEDLGAVVHLGPGKDTNHETVLPVVLFEDAVGGGPKRYRFSLKTTGRAKVDVAVFAGDREVSRRKTNPEEAGSPFTVEWSAGLSAEGWYRVVLSGQFEDGPLLDKELTFYHRPALDR